MKDKKKRPFHWDFYRSTPLVRWLRTKPWTLQVRDFFRLMRFYGPLQAWRLSREIWSESSDLVELSKPVALHPIYLRRRSSDSRVFYEIFGEKIYDFRLPAKASTVVDIGANIGMASVFFAQHYPDAKIVAIEPAGSNISILRQNTNLYPNINVLESGVWYCKEPLRFRNPDVDFWEFRVEPCREEEANFPTVTIPEILDRYAMSHIDILKIDVEGAERELLLRDDPVWLDRVSLIMMELHGELIEDRIDEIRAVMNAHGLYWLGGKINVVFGRDKSLAVAA